MERPASDACGNPPPRGNGRIRVVVADRTPMGCQLLRKAIGSHRRLEVAASVSSLKDLMVEVRRATVDSCLVSADLQDGYLSGLRAVTELHADRPALPIVVLCDNATDDLVIQSFRAGARGLLCRSESIDMLCKCLHAVHNGQIWANSNQLQLLLQELAKAPPARAMNAQGLNLLAEREGQVVSLVADGLTNRDIAHKLGLGEHTVSNYLFRIYNKLGVSNRVELVLYVMRQREHGALQRRDRKAVAAS